MSHAEISGIVGGCISIGVGLLIIMFPRLLRWMVGGWFVIVGIIAIIAAIANE